MLSWLSFVGDGLAGFVSGCGFLSGPLLLRIRKQVFQHVACKTIFPILRDSTPVHRLRVCVVVCSVFQSGG